MVFNTPEIFDGVSEIPVMIGMYGLSEMLIQISEERRLKIITQKLKKVLPSFRQVIRLLVSVIFMTALGLAGARYFSRLISTPKRFLIPAVLLFCLIGSYAINNSMFESNLRRSRMLSQGDWSTVLSRPISLSFLLIAFLILAGPPLVKLVRKR